MIIDFFKYSDTGGRSENQDSVGTLVFNDKLFACVADGVGGANCGQVASQESVQFFLKNINVGFEDLEYLINASHENIKQLQNLTPACKGMATTFTGCVISGNTLKLINVGDSRICILRGNGIRQLSESHSEVVRLIKAGKIKSSDLTTYPRKHILESALGINGQLIFQLSDFELQLGDRILLTTDGVHDVISKVEFRDLSISTVDVNRFGERVIELLSIKKLTDNVSFIIISVN